MKRNDLDARAALYTSLLTGPLPPEMEGTPEELAQRTRDSIAAVRLSPTPTTK